MQTDELMNWDTIIKILRDKMNEWLFKWDDYIYIFCHRSSKKFFSNMRLFCITCARRPTDQKKKNFFGFFSCCRPSHHLKKIFLVIFITKLSFNSVVLSQWKKFFRWICQQVYFDRQRKKFFSPFGSVSATYRPRLTLEKIFSKGIVYILVWMFLVLPSLCYQG